MSAEALAVEMEVPPFSETDLAADDVLAYVVRQTFACGQPGPRRTLSKPVATAIQCALDRHGQSLSVGDLAQAAGLSKFHFTRRFRREAGLTPGAFLRRLRIARAMELLVESNRDVNLIARDVGYEDHAAFTRAFNRIMGTPPSHYRLTRATALYRNLLAASAR